MTNAFEAQPSKLADFGQVLLPSEAKEPILSKAVRTSALEWLTEIGAKSELEAVGCKPRTKALFDGPPGVGKTTLAHHLAARVGLPMVCVRSDRVIDKWVGSSAENMGNLFDAAESESKPVILFFDEFDSLADKRSGGQHKAITQMVNTLLSRMENYDGFIIAATNFATNIDSAVWRRFDIQIKLELPGQTERRHILARYLAPYILPADALDRLATSFETASPALMRQFCEGVKRQIVVGPKVGWCMDRDALIGRVISAVQPHPDLGKPRLWSRGTSDDAIRGLPWPLSTEHQTDLTISSAEKPTNVVALGRGAR
ncbi:MAG TPA: ATP-binding protein [Rhizomicrobium sp.]|jgi:hypothetical protein|nr:ATP-binding protein [Rhizomicrobium sp.]